MGQLVNASQRLFDGIRGNACSGVVGNGYRNHAGIMLFTHPPDVQVGQSGVFQCRQGLADALDHRTVHFGIQQDPAGFFQKPNCPHSHHHRTNNAHHRIKPVSPPPFAAKQGHNGQHRRQGIGEHVDISGAQIQVVVFMAVMIMAEVGMIVPGVIVI